MTGITVRPKVELTTAAKDAYQAAAAVASPDEAADFDRPSLPLALPIPSRKNVTASSRNTSAIAAVVRSEATNM